ncbi:MAG: arylsulfatase A-like enzyme [Limisphaerales bacterium]|jgi:arylsulfatase A-like enzyme
MESRRSDNAMNSRHSVRPFASFSVLVGVLLFFVSDRRATHAAHPNRPNILFIAVDDLRPELGCYGTKEIKTPNIDAFAASGVLFNRAYCQQAVCNPSRASIMTGLRPDSTKVWDLITDFRDTVPDVVTLPQQFMKHGYYAVAYGKIYHNPIPDPKSWNEPNHWPKQASTWTPEGRRALADYRKKMKADGKSAAAIRRMRAPATEIQDVPDSRTPDGEIADQALAAMRELAKKDQPFFLAAGFIRPHLPFVAPRKYWELYDREKIPLAANPFLPRSSPALAMNTMYELRDYFDFAGTDDPREGALTEAQQRRLKHGYYASVSLIDAQVGRLLKELEKLGLADDTIVVLWGDHGWKLGEHRSWCKQSDYEIDARVPLIIRAPGAKANGKRSNALVEFVDVYPTLCDLAGLPLPAHLEGRSMKPLLSDASLPFKPAAFSQFKRRHEGGEYMGYAMRTERYRLIEWLDRSTSKTVATELYDHLVDPHENENIAAAGGNAGLVKELSAKQWNLLPRPKPRAATKGKKGGRPQLTIRNRSRQALAVYWLRPGGDPRKSGVVEIGKDHVIGTAIGHKFEIRGDVTDFKTTVTVKRQSQTFTVNAGKRAIGPKSSSNNPAKRPLRQAQGRPNIVFLMADDWSFPHAGALGDSVVKTPHFDRVAREGVLFPNAFVSTPSCTPSRLSILAGQHHWRLREGDSLGGSLREEYDVYTEMLQKAGYRIGRYGKGVWPSKHSFRKRDSFGERFKSFDEFVEAREGSEPFCFWFGGSDPHRPYELGVGAKSGIDLDKITPPACLPNTETVRSDVADYYWEVQRFDRQVGEVLSRLETMGELENTIVVVSGDNGMPFPRCKATLYDLGTRVPLAVRWGAKVTAGRTVEDFVNLCDFAPTFLEAAGLKPGSAMTGKSLLRILQSSKSGQVDPGRSFVLTGMERHVYSNPSRAIRNEDFLYIRKFDSANWPTGEVTGHNPTYDFAKQPWPTEPGAFSFNIDPGPAKQFLRLNRDEAGVKRLAGLSFGGHANEELYDLRKDPDQLSNVASQPAYRKTRERMRRQLIAELIKSKDPRIAIEGYTSHDLEGWAVGVSERLRREDEKGVAKGLELLGAQLKRVTEVLPSVALARVRDIPIWISPKYPDARETAEYHPSGSWLRANKRHPDLAKSVEFTNFRNLPREVIRMPMLALHELAHGYHDQVLGFDHAEVEAAYRRARDSGSYDAVERPSSGKKEKAYAMSNAKEYFAETTEAYFGVNDFFPFNREDLKKHDPRMFKLLEKLWFQGETSR